MLDVETAQIIHTHTHTFIIRKGNNLNSYVPFCVRINIHKYKLICCAHKNTHVHTYTRIE